MAEFFIDRDQRLGTTSMVLASKDALRSTVLSRDFCLDCPVRNTDGGCTGLAYNPNQIGINAIMPSKMENQCGIINDPDQTIVTRDILLSIYNTLMESVSRGESPDEDVMGTLSDFFDRLRMSVISEKQNEGEEDEEPTWENLAIWEWSDPDTEEERIELQAQAEKFQLTTLQVAKIEVAVWKGTYTPKKYGDPRALKLVHEVAAEIGRDEAVKGLIEDFCDVKFDKGITLEQALSDLPNLEERHDRRAADMIGGVLREILPDSVIVDRRKANEAIQQEFRHDKDVF